MALGADNALQIVERNPPEASFLVAGYDLRVAWTEEEGRSLFVKQKSAN
jgi:hypothetical protein